MPKTFLLRVMSLAFLIFHIEIDTSIMHSSSAGTGSQTNK